MSLGTPQMDATMIVHTPSSSAKGELLSPDFSDSIKQFLPTEVSGSEEVEDDEDDEEDVENLDEDDHCEQEREADTATGAADSQEPQPAATSAATTKFRGRPSSCVFVASLAASLSDDELCLSVTENFKKYGQLTMVKVLRDPANRPYAFVQYTNDADAKSALNQAQGGLLNGRTIRCEPARVNRTLFLSYKGRFTNLDPPSLVSAAVVSKMMAKFGELEQLVACRDQYPHRKNYCQAPSNRSNAWFVQFAFRDDAIRAFANLKTDYNWVVEWAQNIDAAPHMNLLNNGDGLAISGDNQSPDEEFVDNFGVVNENSSTQIRGNFSDVVIDQKSIFIGQLDSKATEKGLYDRFSRHGPIIDVNLLVKPNNVFAFIKFATEEAAVAALEMENHAIFLNKTMHVQYREVGGSRKSRRGSRNTSLSHVDNQQANHNSHHYHHQGYCPVASGPAISGAGNHGLSYKTPYQPPRLNLAPPPINVGKRRSSTGSGPLYSTYPSYQELHGYNQQHQNQLSVLSGPKKFKTNSRRKSVEITKSQGGHCDSNKDTKVDNSIAADENSTNHSFIAETTTSDDSVSADTNDASTMATSSHYTTSAGGINYKKRLDEYKKRGNYPTFDPYYYPPYYYPIDYAMGPAPPAGHITPLNSSGSPSHSGLGANHSCFMYYPVPHISGMESGEVHNLMGTPHLAASPGALGHAVIPIPISQQHFIPMDTNPKFNGGANRNLDY
ncbi:LADA_0G03356g1_1 [Lachancea dasiensis]|uniref:LADA_0G03356g1_1 n=1 Tax=Lachancea dasiensis TaxID=1072105 RepID=A0A1G4JRL7_9SACH|nr:LADA_0G03356g1_1 [Lachancea dasiensis]